MREFSLLGFVGHLAVLGSEVEHHNHEAMEKCGKLVEEEAKDVIGTYRYGWPSLAASTLAKKAADTPLLETGEMRDSIGHTVGHNEVEIGSTSQIAVYQELGTSRIPPRPFLEGALKAKVPEVLDTIGARRRQTQRHGSVITPSKPSRPTPQ